MGWCTHPKRRIGSEVRIYVRANELPCRNDWANDLWQARDAVNADVVVDAIASPVTPATEAEIGSLAALANRPKPEADAADAAARGEDVVVGEVTALSTPSTPATASYDSRRLRRAHSELRAQKREQRSGVAPLAGTSSSLPPTESGMWLAEDLTGPKAGPEGEEHVANRDSSDSKLEIGDVSPVALGEIGRPFPKLTTFPDDDARFSSIPEPVEGFELPLAQNRETKRIVGRAGFDDDHDLVAWNQHASTEMDSPSPSIRSEFDAATIESPRDDVAQPPRRRFIGARRPKPARESLPVADDFLNDFLDQPARESAADLMPEPRPRFEASPTRPASHAKAELPMAEPVRRAAPRRDLDPSHDDRPEPVRRERWNDRASAEQLRHQETSRSRPLVDDAVRDLDYGPEPVWEDQLEPEYDDVLISPDAEDDDVLAEPPRWSSIPRMCRTCRDFRPAENGERGWCTNKWAFSHRRMVDADELPCETSIGGWWLPHDDIWMSALDVTAHSQPTPLLDQWLAQRAAANGELDITRPARRRQR